MVNKMDLRLFVFLLLPLLCSGSGDVYLVTMEGKPVVSYIGGIEGFSATAPDSIDEMDITSESVTSYSLYLKRKHDELLDSLFEAESYKKIYSYCHLINGFSVHLTPEQAKSLSKAPGVMYVEKDVKVRKLTTHTPQFLGLPTGVWPTGGGFDKAGEDVVIGLIDSGVFPKHPSFATYNTDPYGPLPRYRGKCEIDPETKRSFCNGKIIGAQHFAKAAIAAGAFNPAVDFPSPLDGDGHGTHTAAIAAGNNGIPVRMHGHEFGKASGMAPRARIAIYKVLYRLFGGYVSDVVAAIDQAVQDGVDVINLSVGPNSPPSTTKSTFLNPFDAALLSAVKAGVFVAQAAGNGGPFPKTLVSFSPWITTVAAAVDDRRYKNHITLGNGEILPGLGLSRQLMMERRSHLYWTPCAAHCIDLMLEDIGKLFVVKNVIKKALQLTGYIYNHGIVLNIMRRYTNGAELVRPGITRFATSFLMLASIYKQKENLRRMFVSEDWSKSRFSIDLKGKKAKEIILKFRFWNDIAYSLKVTGPLVKMLRLVDSDKCSAMGYIYEAMDRVKEAISCAFKNYQRKYESIFSIIDNRWQCQLRQPLHQAGYYLNPEFFYKNKLKIQADGTLMEGLYAVISRLVVDPNERMIIDQELSIYNHAGGFFATKFAVKNRDKRAPASSHANKSFDLVSVSDVLLDSSVMKYNPLDCQRPELLNKNLVEGKILLCGYSFNFVSGTASIRKVCETAKSLGAAGFVVAVESSYPGTKYDPVPVALPGILITDVSQTKELIDYYNCSTKRDWAGRPTGFHATASIADGLAPILHNSAPQVALFSSRGPDVKDFSFEDADVLKPDILAPGSLIWAAWAPNGTDEANYEGEGFAMVSGTSMATPHIAGIAALMKQKYPHWSPAAIKSALMTTANTMDRAGRPLQAQQYSDTEIMTLSPATPFDYGSGEVDPTAALDPGLILDTTYLEYINFLCSIPGVDPHEVSNITNSQCNVAHGQPSDLNSPSITISHLAGTRTVKRTVTNVAETETYVMSTRMSPEIALEASPPAMTILAGSSKVILVSLTVRSVTGRYSFGEIMMKGDRGHLVRIPVVAMGFSN